MIQKTDLLWDEGENTYDNGKYQLQYVDSFIHENAQRRPGILIVPGGAYTHLSGNESGNVAQRFFELGYQAFVLNYTIDETQRKPLKLQPLRDISRAMRFIRSEEKRFKLYASQIAVCGFSAGGHLAACLCTHFNDIPDDKYPDVSNRPNAAVLCYPVITGGFYAHKNSFRTLLGDMATLDEIKYMSVEKQVTPDTPPTFIWTTCCDESVPPQNSELYARACIDNGVPAALHIFSEGKHGIGLGGGTDGKPMLREVAVWPQLADIFLQRYMYK